MTRDRALTLVTIALAAILGALGFAGLFAFDATDDYAGWPPVVAFVLLGWWAAVGYGDPDQPLSLGRRIFAVALAGLLAALTSIGGLWAMVEVAHVFGYDAQVLALALLCTPVLIVVWLALLWGASRLPRRAAVKRMLGRVTSIALGSLVLDLIALRITDQANLFLVGIVSAISTVTALVVLGWAALGWLAWWLDSRRTTG